MSLEEVMADGAKKFLIGAYGTEDRPPRRCRWMVKDRPVIVNLGGNDVKFGCATDARVV